MHLAAGLFFSLPRRIPRQWESRRRGSNFSLLLPSAAFYVARTPRWIPPTRSHVRLRRSAGTPADKAGLVGGDSITTVDGQTSFYDVNDSRRRAHAIGQRGTGVFPERGNENNEVTNSLEGRYDRLIRFSAAVRSRPVWLRVRRNGTCWPAREQQSLGLKGIAVCPKPSPAEWGRH